MKLSDITLFDNDLKTIHLDVLRLSIGPIYASLWERLWDDPSVYIVFQNVRQQYLILKKFSKSLHMFFTAVYVYSRLQTQESIRRIIFDFYS